MSIYIAAGRMPRVEMDEHGSFVEIRRCPILNNKKVRSNEICNECNNFHNPLCPTVGVCDILEY